MIWGYPIFGNIHISSKASIFQVPMLLFTTQFPRCKGVLVGCDANVHHLGMSSVIKYYRLMKKCRSRKMSKIAIYIPGLVFLLLSTKHSRKQTSQWGKLSIFGRKIHLQGEFSIATCYFSGGYLLVLYSKKVHLVHVMLHSFVVETRLTDFR